MANQKENRILCYSAFVLVYLKNKPSYACDIVEKVDSLFNLAFNTIALSNSVRLGNGGQLYDVIPGSKKDNISWSFYLKLPFYNCLQRIIAEDTGSTPEAGVGWLAERYRRGGKLPPTPFAVFEKAVREFNKKI